MNNPKYFPELSKVGSVAKAEGEVTLRDHFAGQVLCGWYAKELGHVSKGTIAENCYLMADAMLEARAK